MKCEEVQELFPEMAADAAACPEARKHMQSCADCAMLFRIFRDIEGGEPARLPEAKSRANCRRIYKRMHRHDVRATAGRISAIAAVLLIMLVPVFRSGTAGQPGLADVPDEVLYMESDAEMLAAPEIDEEAMIEYLAQNQPIESLGELF